MTTATQAKPAPARRYNCKIRLHKWDHDPPGPGSRCELCGRPWVGVHRGPRRPAVPAAPAAALPSPAPEAAPKMARVIDLSRFRERCGIAAPGTPPATTTPAPAAPSTPEPEAAKEIAETTVSMGKISEWLAEPLAEFMVELARRRVEKKGFVPNAPDADWQEKLKECVTKLLAEKLPEIEMKPFSGAIVAWAAVYVSMRWRAMPLDDRERKELEELRAWKSRQSGSSPLPAGSSPLPSSGSGVAPASHAAAKDTAGDIGTSETTAFPRTLLPQDNSWLTGDGGSATDAAAPASAA